MNRNETAPEADAGAEMDEATVEKIEAEFRRVMAWVADLAVTEGREEEIMEALFAVIVNVGDHDGEDLDE